MVRASELPLLPLMMAGLPPAISRILRQVGLPCADLSRLALSAEGTGRFVLFDSRSSESLQRVRAVRSQGLKPIDFAEIDRAVAGGLGLLSGKESGVVRAYDEQDLIAIFLRELKLRLEAAGGLWLRLADFPFPFRAGLAVAIDQPEPSRWLPAAIPTTCFVAPKLRDDDLKGLLLAPSVELAWKVGPGDFELTPRKTITHWRTRLDRFARSGWPVSGLRLSEPLPGLPRAAELLRMGFAYTSTVATHGPGAGLSVGLVGTELPNFPLERIESTQSRSTPASWITLGSEAGRAENLDASHVLSPLTPVSTRPQSPVAQNLFPEVRLLADLRAGQLSLVELSGTEADEGSLVRLRQIAQQIPLVWTCTLSQLARWLKRRSQARLLVWRRDGGYEVQLEGPVGGEGHLGIELWRGAHQAHLPLVTTVLPISDDGLLFQTPESSPGGWLAARPAQAA
jgi:hypothetical protein